MEDQDTVEEYLKLMLEAVLDSDKYFIILGDAENDAMTFHAENIPMEDIMGILEGTLWKLNEEHKHDFEEYTEYYT